MSREIKFRAWVHGEMMEMPVSTPYAMQRFFGFLDANGVSSFDKVMQFTGLRDRDGVEIYEGDVVVGSVGFGTTKLTVKFSSTQHGWYPFIVGCNHEKCEVIGNIWESPDLLAGGGV